MINFTEEEFKNRTLMVAHVDLDGIMPFALNHFCGFPFTKEIPTNYEEKGEHHELSLMGENDYVLYVDFTPDEEARKIITEKGIDCTIIDHHESQSESINEWKKTYPKVEFIYDSTKSGTLLYYEYLCSKNTKVKGNRVVEEICNLVSTYDLWQKDSPLWEKAQNLNRLMWKIANWAYKDEPLKLHEYFINGQVWKMENADSFFFNRFEQEKIDADIKAEREIFIEYTTNRQKIKTRKDSNGNYFSIIKLNKKVSIICSMLLEKYRKLDYIICINTYDSDTPRISIRSKEHINVLDFKNVKGHAQAGGMENVTAQLCEDLWSGKIYELARAE